MREPSEDLISLQRENTARRIGADLYRSAAAISPLTIDAVAAAVSRMSTISALDRLVAEGFGGAMVADSAESHLIGLPTRGSTVSGSVSATLSSD